jgi:hypothetical protein
VRASLISRLLLADPFVKAIFPLVNDADRTTKPSLYNLLSIVLMHAQAD